MRQLGVSFLIAVLLLCAAVQSSHGQNLNRNSNDYQVLLRTVYAEARGEPTAGQKAVAWVIKNRAYRNLRQWGGNNIANVCKQPRQFSCWNGVSDIPMTNTRARNGIDAWLPTVYTSGLDNTNGATHYYAYRSISPPPWASSGSCVQTVTIGNHRFYRCRN